MGRRTASVVRVAGAAVAVLALFVGGLVVAEAVPDDVVARRLASDLAAGRYATVLDPDAIGGFHDGYTECVSLGVGLGTPPEPMGLLPRAIWAPRIGACEQAPEQVTAIAEGQEVRADSYVRYWNGSAPLVRPVVAVAGVTGLRIVVGLLLLGTAVLAALAVGRRLGWSVTASLALPAALATNAAVTPVGSLTHAISLSAVLAGVAAVAVGSDRGGWRGAAVAAAGGAALFVYVDLLTTPAIPWALAAFVAGAVGLERHGTTAALVRHGAAAGLAWPIAYAVTWSARWGIAAAVHGDEVLASVAAQSRFRLSGAHDGVVQQLGAATRANVDWWIGRTATAPVVLALALLVCAGALVLVARRRGEAGTPLGQVALLAAPALVVPAWYELLSNHSQIHAFFTYRSVPVAVGIGTAACVLVAQRVYAPLAAEGPTSRTSTPAADADRRTRSTTSSR